MFALRIKDTKKLVRFYVGPDGDFILDDGFCGLGLWVTNTREYAEKIASRKYGAWGEYHTPYIRDELIDVTLEVVELKIMEI